MQETEFHDRAGPECTGPIGTGSDKGKPHFKRKMAQVRFITACTRGHLQDFPWWEWVFKKPDPNRKGLRLRMHTSGSASLAGVRIACEVNSEEIKSVAKKTLSGAFDYSLGERSSLSRLEVYCRGENPALGIPSASQPSTGCGSDLYPLLRGSSNVYFPHVVSSIYLPYKDNSFSEDLLEILEDPNAWFFLKTVAGTRGKISRENAENALQTFFPGNEISAEKLAEAAMRKLEGFDKKKQRTVTSDSGEEAFRRQEYDLFRRDVQEGYPKTNLLIRNEPISSYGPIIKDNFERISLVHKMRETRAFSGFSRIFPRDDLSEQERKNLITRTPKNWLPAVIVRGEGLFMQLREKKIESWGGENGIFPTDRLCRLQETYDLLRTRRNQGTRPVTPRFILLHTLSHLLINQLIHECGYGSASLRERLYSSDGEQPMAGILIYTAAGDSEGTMGGLVRMGRPGRLEMVLRTALENARWCSTDPVCIESVGQGPDSCNLAACHSCCLLPETSCEEQNRLLDRGAVVGTLSATQIGYFNI